MDYITQPKDYWIAPTAISITRNALGDPNRIQGGVASGAVISCYIEGVEGLGLDNGRNPKRWALSFSPTYFNSNTQKYVYVAIPRSIAIGTQAVVVFPSEKLDIYGKNEEDTQVGSSDYYYVWLQGILSSSGQYGEVNRVWTAEIDFGSLGTYEDIMDMTETDWYSYSKVSGVVTFLKPIIMKVGSYFQNIFLGNKELTGVATATTSEKYVDSETLVVTPSYLNGKYLSRQKEDTAEEQIGFLKGLWVGVKGLYEITAEGIAKFKSLFVDDITAERMQVEDMQSSNYTGDGIADTGWRLTKDYNGHSKLTIDELYVRMKAVFESLEVKKELVTGGNQVQSCAASVISKVDYLDVNKDILGYEVYKIPFTLRNAIMMLAKGQNPFGSYGRTRTVRLQLTAAERQSVRYVRCYFLAEEGDRKIQNWWRVADPNDNTTGNDLARCQTFNLSSDSVSERDTYFGTNTQKIGNIFWWRKVAGVSSAPVEIDGKMYHYFDVYCNPTAEAATPYTYSGAMQGSDIPAPGDEVSQWGNDNNIDRMNLIVQEVNGQDAAIKMYEGINKFSMGDGLYGNPLKIRFAPKTGCKVHTTKWEVVTDSFIAPIPVECGNWTAGTVAKYYEIYQHNGGSWLCVASNGGSFKVFEAFSTYAVGDTIAQAVYDTLTVRQQMCCARVAFGTTTDEPSTTSAAWRQYAAKGEKGDNAIRLALANEHEDFLYNDAGNCISPDPQIGATSAIRLYNGNTEVTSQATLIVSARVGTDEPHAYITGTTLYVTGLTANTAKVTVRAEYPQSSGKYYYAEFTANKTKQDKYDLYVRPNAIAYNSATYSPITLAFEAKRTDLQGNKTEVTISTSSGGTYVAGNFYLFFGYVKADGSIVNPTGGSTLYEWSNMQITSSICETYVGIYFELRYYTTSSAYRLCDFETVEIARAENGANGEDAITATASPSVINVECLSNGVPKTTPNPYPQITFNLQKADGTTANNPVVDSVDGITTAQATPVTVQGITYSSVTKGGITILWNASTAISHNIALVKYSGGAQGTAISPTTFTIGVKSTAFNATRYITIAINANNQGVSVTNTVTYYMKSEQSSGITPASGGWPNPSMAWTTTPQEPTFTQPYAWRFTATFYSDGSVSTTDCEMYESFYKALPRLRPWQSGQDYQAGGKTDVFLDIVVTENGDYFRCIENHTSTNNNKPGTPGGSVKWTQSSHYDMIDASIILTQYIIAQSGLFNNLVAANVTITGHSKIGGFSFNTRTNTHETETSFNPFSRNAYMNEYIGGSSGSSAVSEKIVKFPDCGSNILWAPLTDGEDETLVLPFSFNLTAHYGTDHNVYDSGPQFYSLANFTSSYLKDLLGNENTAIIGQALTRSLEYVGSTMTIKASDRPNPAEELVICGAKGFGKLNHNNGHMLDIYEYDPWSWYTLKWELSFNNNHSTYEKYVKRSQMVQLVNTHRDQFRNITNANVGYYRNISVGVTVLGLSASLACIPIADHSALSILTISDGDYIRLTCKSDEEEVFWEIEDAT